MKIIKTDRTQFQKGEYILLTTGAYSDYWVDGLFMATKDLDISSAVKTGHYGKYYDMKEFIADGSLIDVDCSEVWCGS